MGLIELKPCPFCGGKAGLYHTYDGLSCVQCDECGISTLRKMDARLAIQMWNRRSSEIEWIPVSEKLPRLEDDMLVTVRNKWIPVSEKLPRLEDDVLVTVRNKETGTSAVWSGVRYKNGWAISAYCDYIDLYDTDSELEVIAWAHLPEAYKEAGGNE